MSRRLAIEFSIVNMHADHVRREHNGQGVYAYTFVPRISNVKPSQEQIYLTPRAILSDSARRSKPSAPRNNNIIIVMVFESSACSRHERVLIFTIIHRYYRYPFSNPVGVKIIQKSDTAVVLFFKKNFQRNIDVSSPLSSQTRRRMRYEHVLGLHNKSRK